LRSTLSRIAGLQVAARTSSELMRNADAKEAAAKLGVAHVLTGSVRKGGGTIRVSTQLLNGETGLETWSQAYDRPEGDALVVQTSIATSVANALSLSLGKAAAMLGGTKNPAAYDAYLRAEAIINRDEAGFRSRIAAVDIAIAIDPDFAVAHARRSVSLTNLFWEVGGFDLLDAAGRAATRANTLTPTLPAAQSAAAYHQIATLDFRGAAQTYDKLLHNPNAQSQGHSAPAVFLANIGRTQEGLNLAEKAVALDPLSILAKMNLATVLIAARQGKAALDVSEAAIAAHPDEKANIANKGRSLLLLNRPAEALAAIVPLQHPRLRAAWLAIAYAMHGDRAGSDKALEVLKADYADIGAYQIARAHAARGEPDLAFAALDHAIAVKSRGLEGLRTDFSIDPLRNDRRYVAIEKRLGFPPL
jgi:serine/threonine-protein kinase